MTWLNIHWSAAPLASDFYTKNTTLLLMNFLRIITIMGMYHTLSATQFVSWTAETKVIYRLSACTLPSCPLSLIQFNVGNPNPCDQSMVVTNTFTDFGSGCIDIAVYCQHPSFTLYEVFFNGTVQVLNASGHYDGLICQSSPTSGFYSYYTDNNLPVSQVYCSNRKLYHRCGNRDKL